MTQSILEVLSRQIRFFMCCDAQFAQKIYLKGILKFPYLPGCFFGIFALVFSRVERLRGPDPLVLSQMIVNWAVNPSACFGTTFSTPYTFQVQTLTEIYDKIRVF